MRARMGGVYQAHNSILNLAVDLLGQWERGGA